MTVLKTSAPIFSAALRSSFPLNVNQDKILVQYSILPVFEFFSSQLPLQPCSSPFRKLVYASIFIDVLN